MEEKLTPVIEIDETKCVNCYACINACPVKYCNDGSGEKVAVNGNMCIGCGNCIAACTHKARKAIDDSKRFFDDLKHGQKIVAVAAPSVASVFPGKYLNLNGWLKSMGVSAVFDVSFAAELTVVSYLNYIKAKNPRMVISQPCPAIVNFIEIFRPELLQYLAPADSPMLHALKMVQEYYPRFKDHKLALISPCIAKRRELDETGVGDYNVTMISIKNYIDENHINLSSYPADPYMGPLAERAVLFSTPGGLLDTAERFIPGIRRNTRKIEGVPGIYHYLEDVYSMLNKPDTDLPLLVDCLNCEKGCNGGPGTGNNKKPVDELESPVRRRSAELEKQLNPKQKENLYNKYHRLLDKYWKPGLYDRKYKNKSQNYTVKQPTEAQLTEVFKRMRKFSDADIYDCTSCGYGSCKGMAVAIFNKLNKPENCAHNNLSLLEEEKQAISAINQKLSTHIGHALGLIEIINNAVNDLSGRVSSQTTALDKSTNLTEEMVSSLRSTTSLSIQKREAIARLIENASRGQSSMQETIQSVQEISHSVDDIAAAIKIISGIAANTNLLAMNAAIEAAHAGEAGKGFAVVADEIRHLSETTSANSRNISKTLSNIIQGINITSRRSDETNSAITEMSGEIRGFADTMTSLINTFSELSGESESISAALGTLREMYGSVKSGYSDMLSMTGRLTDNMNDLAQIAGER